MLRKTRAFSNIKIRMWKLRALFLMNFISGDVHGPIDLAAVPIGAYHPRDFLKAQHVDPVEAVQIHQDIKAKKSVGIHWGTFELGREAFLGPRRELEAELQKKNLSDKDFFTTVIGESVHLFL